MQHFGEMAADAQDNVADIGQPLADVGVFGLLEQGGVFLQHLIQGVRGALMLIDDPGANFLGERRIAEDRLVCLENRRFGRANLRGDFRVERPEIGGRRIARALVMGQLRHHFLGFQLPRGWIHEDFVDAVGGAHDDARRYSDSFAHCGLL